VTPPVLTVPLDVLVSDVLVSDAPTDSVEPESQPSGVTPAAKSAVHA